MINSSIETVFSKVKDIQYVTSTVSSTYTITEAGVYEFVANPSHTPDSCPTGTGRYACSISCNGTVKGNYSDASMVLGGGAATAKFVGFLKVGDVITVSANTTCSNCSYYHNDSATLTVKKWNFIYD